MATTRTPSSYRTDVTLVEERQSRVTRCGAWLIASLSRCAHVRWARTAQHCRRASHTAGLRVRLYRASMLTTCIKTRA
jgi:hypothetical protein